MPRSRKPPAAADTEAAVVPKVGCSGLHLTDGRTGAGTAMPARRNDARDNLAPAKRVKLSHAQDGLGGSSEWSAQAPPWVDKSGLGPSREPTCPSGRGRCAVPSLELMRSTRPQHVLAESPTLPGLRSRRRSLHPVDSPQFRAPGPTGRRDRRLSRPRTDGNGRLRPCGPKARPLSSERLHPPAGGGALHQRSGSRSGHSRPQPASIWSTRPYRALDPARPPSTGRGRVSLRWVGGPCIAPLERPQLPQTGNPSSRCGGVLAGV